MQNWLNLRRLSFFQALAETSSFTTAAQMCGVSQPGLSAAIRDFEDELGVRLFQRDTRNVRLTAHGEALLPLVEVALNNAARTDSDIRDLVKAKRNNVRIAAVSSITSFLLPASVAQFEKAHPSVHVEMLDVENPRVTQWVQDGRVDLGVGLGPFDLSVFEPIFLFSDRLVAVVAGSHRLARLVEVNWAEVGLEPIVCYQPASHVYQMIDRTLAAHGIRFEPRGTFSYRQTLFGWALDGDVVTILPSLSLDQTLPPGLVQVPLSGPTVSRQYFIVSRKHQHLTEHAMNLQAHLRSQLTNPEGAAFGPV